MKQEKIVSTDSRDGTGRLIVSVVLAFIVMLFINGFIGSMGGVPTFLAFLVMFYMTRTWAVDRLQAPMTEQLRPQTEDEKGQAGKAVMGLFAGFSLGYLLIWSLLRVLMTISRVTGWGNLSGASAARFVKELFQTSLLEKTSYLAAGILMFTFVLSLFPLVVIKGRRNWIIYALVDAAGFALVCLGTGWLSSLASDNPTDARAVCLIDQFLLCREFALWQDILAMLFLLIIMSVVGLFSCWFSVRSIRQRPKHMEETKAKGVRGKNWFVNVAAAVCGLVTVAVVVGIILLVPEDTREGYGKVAEFLTEDTVLGPMEYGGRIYVPVDEKLKLDETGTPQGYLAGKNENCDSRFYRLAVANLLYSDETCRTDRVQMRGRQEGVYAPIENLDPVEAENCVFVLWDEDWEKESAYSHEPTGYALCNEGLMQGLSMQFPKVTYRPQDFEDYDAYFTIRAYPSMDALLERDAVSGRWAGCILIRDNKFYYGSYENEITGICLQQLREILGGNKK